MIQRLRLLSGLVLLTYVTTHLLNHAVGIFSVETAEVPRQWFIAFWRNPVLTVVLYTSLLTHISLALMAIYRRRTLRLPRWELLRLTLGLLIPLGLTLHLFATRIPHELFAVLDDYPREIATFWVVTGVLVPGLALMGFVGMGREVTLLAIDPAWLRQAVAPLPPGGPSLMESGIVLVLVLWVGA